MLKDIQALENYLTEKAKFEEKLNPETMEFVRTKISRIKDMFNEMQGKVARAEEKEKLGIEKQKEFGKSQTKVEESRHQNIMEEIKALKEAGIKAYNRSSYPFLPRHKPHFKKDGKKEVKNEPRTR